MENKTTIEKHSICRKDYEEDKMKLDYSKHYINKLKTKHYYLGYTFDNFEWRQFTHGVQIQGLNIGHSSKYRVKSKYCERYYNQDNGSTSIARPCKNLSFYRSSTGGYFCKSCARAISKMNDKVDFNKILPN
jgi:hypothetical protein